MRSFREGDLLETKEGLIFHVKGTQHPKDGAIAFLRYVPSDKGNRYKDGTNYTKIYSLNQKFDYLENNFPKYVRFSEKLQRKIQFVKKSEIKKVYDPSEKLNELLESTHLSELEEKVVKFTKMLIDSGISRGSLGVTGSILAGVQNKKSDIDMIGYGEKEGRKIYSALKKLKETNPQISWYNSKNSLRMAKFRWGKTEIPTELFSEIEKEKVLHGLFQNKDYFFRLVKDYENNIESKSFSKKEKRTIKAKIENAEESIFTPNHYKIEKNPKSIKKLTSYRGRFTEQAEEGDTIVARGRIEDVAPNGKKFKRLILGKPDEYILPINDENIRTIEKHVSIENF